MSVGGPIRYTKRPGGPCPECGVQLVIEEPPAEWRTSRLPRYDRCDACGYVHMEVPDAEHE